MSRGKNQKWAWLKMENKRDLFKNSQIKFLKQREKRKKNLLSKKHSVNWSEELGGKKKYDRGEQRNLVNLNKKWWQRLVKK